MLAQIMPSQLEELVNELSTSSQSDARELDKLPEEVLLHIFKQLPHADKLNCTLVSPKWNRLISTSKNFLDSTKLNLKIRLLMENPSMSIDFSISRNYQNVYINLHKLLSITLYDQQLTNILTGLIDIADHIKKLHLYFVPPRFSSQVFRLVKTSVNLETLYLIDIGFNTIDFTDSDGQRSQFKSIKLNKLRSLTVKSDKYSNWMLKYIDCKELDWLKICSILDQYAAEFINNLTRLDTLEFIALQIAQDIGITPKFKWNTLRFQNVSQMPQFTSDRFENLMRQLIVAAKDAANVFLLDYETNPERLVHLLTTFGKIAEIKKLKFAVVVDGINQEFINKFKVAFTSAAQPMRSYLFLEMVDNYKPCQLNQHLAVGCLDWFFALLPNLNQINIPSNFINAFDTSTVAGLFANIKILRILGNITEAELEKLQSLYFPQIHVLGIQFDGHPERLKKFMRTNPSNKRIALINGNDIRKFIVKIVTKEEQHAAGHAV